MTTNEQVHITERRTAGSNHEVLTLQGGSGYRRTVCEQCPWRIENAGDFPAEAFRHSASTSYDASQKTFACHMHTAEKPLVCAGFLLRNSANNLSVRMATASGRIDLEQVRECDGLFDSYKEMAVANGVPEDDPILAACRADSDRFEHPGRIRSER